MGNGRTPTWEHWRATGGLGVLQRGGEGCGKAALQAVCEYRLTIGCPANQRANQRDNLAGPAQAMHESREVEGEFGKPSGCST